MSVDYIVAGLGNPDGKYEQSPHNAGFMVVEKVRSLTRGPRFSLSGNAAVSRCRWRHTSFLLLKPMTYMNLSGKSVARWMRKESLPLERLVVCYDDLDLSFGAVKLKPSGGAGGHHGMESVIAELGGEYFPRIRVGIGDPTIEKPEKIDYLLNPLPAESIQVLDEAASKAAEALLEAVASGFTVAMNHFNRRNAEYDDRLP